MPDEILPLPTPAERRQRRLDRDTAALAHAAEEARTLAESLEYVQAQLARGLPIYRAAAAQVRAADCPRCDSFSCQTAITCRFLFEDDRCHGVDEEPLCRHSGNRSLVQRETQRTRDREARMRSAGIINAEMLRIIPPGRRIADALPRAPESHLVAPRAAAEAAQAFVDGKAPHLVLWGSKGTWKTWALAGIVAGWKERGVAWISAREPRPDDAWSARVAKIRRAPLLCIADLGTETTSEWHRSELAGLITDRDDDGLPVAIASNVPAERVGELYGPRAWDRLQRGLVQRCVGPSLREVL